MAKIPLTIDPGYCADWGAWEGVREFIANAKDAEDDDDEHKMEVQHLPRTSRLIIRTLKTVVDPSALLVLGKTSKRGHDQRGRFGEGFAIGCLALTRAGHPITFTNGDAKWRCSLEHADEDHPFAGSELLTFYSRQVSPAEDFEVEIEGITTEIWEAMKKLFLFLTPPKAKDVIPVAEGSLLIGPDRKGQVFAKGVFVRSFENLSCGYDLKELQLDRDRRMVDEWRLHDQLAELWTAALKVHPAEMAKPVYDLAKSEAPEASHLRWRTDDKLLKTMKKEFEAEYGEKAVPVSTMAEAKEMAALGAKPAVVNTTLKELLAKAGVSAAEAKNTLEGEVARRFSIEDLTPKEIGEGCSHVETLTKDYVIVEFRGESTQCKPLDENKVLGVDRRLLSRPFREIWLHVVKGEARRRNTSETTVLMDAMQAVLTPAKAAEEEGARCDECGVTLICPCPSHSCKHHEKACSLYPSDEGGADLPT